jgi:succinate dehydrogenase hydrophobic anchor subunit
MKKNVSNSSKKELAKFIVQLIAAIASAILTALGASACVIH